MNELKIENLVAVNGQLILTHIGKNEKGSPARGIFKVEHVAKNCNYEAMGKPIEVGDVVVLSEYCYPRFELNGNNYYVCKPKEIHGYFKPIL